MIKKTEIKDFIDKNYSSNKKIQKIKKFDNVYL